MPPARWISAGALSCTLLTAQDPGRQPAPAVETAPSWTAEEGAALALVREIAARRDVARAADQPALLQRVMPPVVFGRGYRTQFFVPDEDGELVPVHARTATDRWCLYAWPQRYGILGKRAFFVANDGPVLVTDNEQRKYEAEDSPSPVAALGRGGSGTLHDIQRGPGLGEDGGFWQTVETLTLADCRVQVIDEQGRPVPGVQVALLPASGIVRPGRRTLGHGLPVPFGVPVGRGQTDRNGSWSVRGPLAREVEVALNSGSRWLPLDDGSLERTADGLRVRISLQSWSEAQRNANESAAMATLKNIASAQAQCQASGAIDCDKDGAGEYGFFGELSGVCRVRNDAAGGVSEKTINPPVLSRAFANVRGSRVVRSGYVFQIFLPGAGGKWRAEAATGGGSGVAIDPDRAEVQWRCYAWPVAPGQSGTRAFFVDQMGDVLASDNAEGRYSGTDKTPAPDAALLPGGDAMGEAAAANQKGSDGQRWTVVR